MVEVGQEHEAVFALLREARYRTFDVDLKPIEAFGGLEPNPFYFPEERGEDILGLLPRGAFGTSYG
jgi:hypothetical protein